jgi:hypothetical protein
MTINVSDERDWVSTDWREYRTRYHAALDEIARLRRLERRAEIIADETELDGEYSRGRVRSARLILGLRQ